MVREIAAGSCLFSWPSHSLTHVSVVAVSVAVFVGRFVDADVEVVEVSGFRYSK
jgi:hypothetical protein